MAPRKESAARSKQSAALSGFLAIGLVAVAGLLGVVSYQLTHIVGDHDLLARQASSNTAIAASQMRQMESSASEKKTMSGLDEYNPLAIPRGQAQNLPSIRVDDVKADSSRNIYGGKGDKLHLGGFTEYDPHGVSPKTWGNMIATLGVKSVIDVGCGRGISALWFHLHGVDTLCVEGSHDAVENSFLPKEIVVEHDFSRGPWWPAKTYDAVWSVEFLEHVGVNYHFNYITTFRKAAILFVTSSQWGGWHHVEVHDDAWWIRKYTAYGFVYDTVLTEKAKKWASNERMQQLQTRNSTAPNGQRYNAQHLYMSMKVFINPVVAALPQHAHLFSGGHGCFEHRQKFQDSAKLITNRPCDSTKSESVLPESFMPLELDPAAQTKWEDILRSSIKQVVVTPRKPPTIGIP